LVIVNLIHKPKQGVFKREKSDKNYYFWSLRAVIKKWPIWLSSIFPSSILINIVLTIFGVKTSFSNNVNNANIDTEFVDLGKEIIAGKGCFIKSCMIVKDSLVIKKVKVEDEAIIGPYSFVSPGTKIEHNTELNTFSVTKINSILKENSIYSGYPASKIKEKSEHENLEYDFNQIFENYIKKIRGLENKHKKHFKSSESKFVINTSTYIGLFIIIYFCAYSIPLFGFYLFFSRLFYPFVLQFLISSDMMMPLRFLSVILFTPISLLTIHLLNILITVLVTKLLYKILCDLNKPKEGIYHWSNKTKDYIYYFIRSFLLRYVKWKVQRSPYPWLIKPVFNFIGNCYIQKGAVIEDMHLSKEFLKIGQNAYLGKILLTNQLWDQELTVKGVKVGENVVICDGCCIAPGTIIKDDTTILPFSITSKDDILKSDSLYYGAPINKIENKEQLKHLMNIN
jgi:carbonic anhydrase/acetyltransferase-like protein (isoleucine patch superfamily)